MGNIIVIVILLLMFGGILYSMFNNFRRNGTVCTTCSHCPVISTCESDSVTDELREFYNSQV